VVLTGLSLSVLAAVRAASPGLMPSPGQWLRHPHPYIVEHYRLIIRTLVLEVGLASGLALIAAHVLLPRTWRGTQARPHNTISVVLHETATEPSAPFVQLRTCHGTLFSGLVAAHDHSGPRADRQIALRPPLAVQRPGDESPHPIPPGWQRVVLPVADVAEMHVAFVRVGQEPEPVGQQTERQGKFGRRRRDDAPVSP
jgi:hypothetical protein